MKALTIYQPWASLIACGAKKYETRSWATKYRGPIAIHAGMKDCVDLMTSEQVNALMKAFAGTPYQVANDGRFGGFDYLYPYGAVIATAELVGCHKIIEPAPIDGMIATGKMIKPFGTVSVYGDELLFGDWTPGRYAWELANVQMLDIPIPAKGKQGLWNWEKTAEIVEGHKS